LSSKGTHIALIDLIKCLATYTTIHSYNLRKPLPEAITATGPAGRLPAHPAKIIPGNRKKLFEIIWQAFHCFKPTGSNRVTSVMTADGKVIPLTDELRANASKTIEDWANGALRTLCLAVRWLPKDTEIPTSDSSIPPFDEDLTLIAIVGIEDPLRKEVPAGSSQTLALPLARPFSLNFFRVFSRCCLQIRWSYCSNVDW